MSEDTTFDPYGKLRDRIQQSITSSHFDAAINLIESLLEQTSPRKGKNNSLANDMQQTTTSIFDQFEELDSSLLSIDVVDSQSSLPYPPSQQQKSKKGRKGRNNKNVKYSEAADLSFGPLHDTVLLECAAKNKPFHLKRMLELGANPHRPNIRGLTPLIKAAGAGHVECCKLLVEIGGADVFTKDQKGRTALDWARIGNKLPAAIFLEKEMETIIIAARDEEFGRVKTAELTRLVDKNKYVGRASEAVRNEQAFEHP